VEKALGIQTAPTVENPLDCWGDMTEQEKYDHWFNMRGY
jgi:hypothetical protein